MAWQGELQHQRKGDSSSFAAFTFHMCDQLNKSEPLLLLGKNVYTITYPQDGYED